jgi:hypothetical protein
VAPILRSVNPVRCSRSEQASASCPSHRPKTSLGERDYGAFDLDEHKLMFKIDYLDVDGIYASDDPSEPAQTLRVLTIMFASEY